MAQTRPRTTEAPWGSWLPVAALRSPLMRKRSSKKRKGLRGSPEGPQQLWGADPHAGP